jgi:S1-C subfamily serine protease
VAVAALFTARPLHAEFNVDGAEESLFRIINYAKDGIYFGSGFLINKKGLVATNYHVTEGHQAIYLCKRVPDRIRVWRARVVYESPAKDMCLLQVDGLEGTPVRLSPKAPSKGTDIVAMGFPGQMDLESETGSFLEAMRQNSFRDLPLNDSYMNFVRSTVKKGNIEDVRMQPWGRQGEPALVVIHNAPTTGGNSGGPLFDMRNRVVGLHTAGRRENPKEATGNKLSLSSSITELKSVLDSLNLPYEVDDTPANPAPAPEPLPEDKKDTIVHTTEESSAKPVEANTQTTVKVEKEEDSKEGPNTLLIVLGGGLITGGLALGVVFAVRGRKPRATPAPLGASPPPPARRPVSQEDPRRSAERPAVQRDLGAAPGPSLPRGGSSPLDAMTDFDRTRGSSGSSAGEHPAVAKISRWVLQGEDREGKRYILRFDQNIFSKDDEKKVTVGRSSGCQLIIKNTSLSRVHAVLFLNDAGEMLVADLGSSNGTRVNSKSLIAETEHHPLKTGDVVEFGEVRLTVAYG